MTLRRAILAIAAVALAVPTAAMALKFSTQVSAHISPEGGEVYGVIQSGDYACEKRREVRLYANDGDGFFRVTEENTNRFGEYRFILFGKAARRLGGGGSDVEFFVRALRKDFPHVVCRRADSNSVFYDFK